VRGVTAYYGTIAALRGVDIEVGDGEIVALIGQWRRKSTLMMTICGNPRAREGSITLPVAITALATHEIARLKVAQGRRAAASSCA
jgi:branched-chain amino acid transport system ATP-binding protein